METSHQTLLEQAEEDLLKSKKKLEERLGLVFTSLPKIEIGLEELENLEEEKIHRRKKVTGEYYELEDTIYLNSEIIKPPHKGLLAGLIDFFTERRRIIIEVVSHELGHSYCNHFLKRYGSNLTCFHHIPNTEREARTLTSEGICEYLSRETIDYHRNKKKKWPTLEEHASGKGFTRNSVYYLGYQLVKPIIDEHKGRAVDYMLLNPFTTKELFLPENYQNRIIDELKKI